ncbi:2Fe-2S iron-sulfur cluster-binding protein [Streptomyces mirabilis]|jgi:2Fe-2S ferredoxin|uniref:Ferredoxin, 2Fe-2S n=1 Tax=Streptomyces mirabilis TaxID=68239 RepID=A0A1I2YB85_9ACTN|nr:ferredoxin, 2Fe-2S [Streptomyces mirabilis]
MPTLLFEQPDGSRSTLDVPEGTSVMQAAVAHGIVAECGGSAMCATCHVYTDPADADRLLPVSDDEDEMLDCTVAPRLDGSWLSCQVVVTGELDSLVVRLGRSNDEHHGHRRRRPGRSPGRGFPPAGGLPGPRGDRR